MENNKVTGTRILIADDDLDILAAITESISSLNESYKITTETGPENAIKLIMTGFYDLILADYIYSGSQITGLQIFEAAEKHYFNHIWVGVLITACGTVSLFEREQTAGLFSDFLEKPFIFTDVKSKIQAAIELLLKRQKEADV
jgi:DNA-binding NtrC family response regulator